MISKLFRLLRLFADAQAIGKGRYHKRVARRQAHRQLNKQLRKWIK